MPASSSRFDYTVRFGCAAHSSAPRTSTKKSFGCNWNRYLAQDGAHGDGDGEAALQHFGGVLVGGRSLLAGAIEAALERRGVRRQVQVGRAQLLGQRVLERDRHVVQRHGVDLERQRGGARVGGAARPDARREQRVEQRLLPQAGQDLRHVRRVTERDAGDHGALHGGLLVVGDKVGVLLIRKRHRQRLGGASRRLLQAPRLRLAAAGALDQ